MASRKTLAVWKFASCDGCQLSLLDGVDELLALAGAVEIAWFLEASKATVGGPYDLSLVEGSITTDHDARRIREIRRVSDRLVTIGACATAGGIQSLRNDADAAAFAAAVYPRPDELSYLPTSTAIGQHVLVDFEVRGCPVNPVQVREVVAAQLAGRHPQIATASICTECKRRGLPCVMVAHGTPCLGPVTQAGCGALCPACARGCYGCYGPMEAPRTDALAAWWRALGVADADIARAFRTFNADAPAFREEARRRGG
jgi:coenzyme F420-reducing hydrogenase gamma subunit